MFDVKRKRIQVQRELHYGRTDDGWRIALHRLPHRHTAPTRAPVLLCHGLGANRFNLDAPGRRSFAQWLWARGHDCWVVELRGAGHSSRPNRKNGLEWDWTFEDYVTQDLPTAIDVIQRVTGRARVHWIGHSMGGMLGYAYLIRHGHKQIASLSAIGSPSFTRVKNPLLDAMLALRPFASLIPKLPYQSTSGAVVPLVPAFKATFGRLLGNPRNLSSFDLARIVRVLPSDLPMSLVLQFADWYSGERECPYVKALHKIEAPTQLLVGQIDHLAPPADIEFIFDAISTDKKCIHVLGKASGCRFDYGHIDPVLGRWAETEVWPRLSAWIDENEAS